MTDDDDRARASLEALNDPARVKARVDRSRTYGVGGLLPPLADMTPLDPEVQQRMFPGVPRGPYTLGDAVEEDEVTEARDRVRTFVAGRESSREFLGDVVATYHPPGGAGIDALHLRLDDLRLLVGPDREDDHGPSDRQA